MPGSHMFLFLFASQNRFLHEQQNQEMCIVCWRNHLNNPSFLYLSLCASKLISRQWYTNAHLNKQLFPNLYRGLTWSPKAWRPMVMALVQPGTRRGMVSQSMGSRKTVPPRMFLKVPLGDFHISFRLNSIMKRVEKTTISGVIIVFSLLHGELCLHSVFKSNG